MPRIRLRRVTAGGDNDFAQLAVVSERRGRLAVLKRRGGPDEPVLRPTRPLTGDFIKVDRDLLADGVDVDTIDAVLEMSDRQGECALRKFEEQLQRDAREAAEALRG